jgi:hypothetical protein
MLSLVVHKETARLYKVIVIKLRALDEVMM